MVLNLPPKYVRFGDQNKTKYVTPRWEITPIMQKSFFNKMTNEFKRTDLYWHLYFTGHPIYCPISNYVFA